MAIIKPAVHLIVREHAKFRFKDPVLMLGVPEIYASYGELQQWFKASSVENHTTDEKAVVRSNNPTGQKHGWVSALSFFKMLGLDQLTSIDIPGCEHQPDLIHDLNQPLPEEMINRFNLVIDPGTIEHVFDLKTGLTNVVRSLKTDGVVIHFVPIYSYNGGYISVNPPLLMDFYSVNGFGEIKAYIVMWDRYHPFTGKHRCYEYDPEIFGPRHALADYDQCRFTPHLLLFARKLTQHDPITVPIQSGPPEQRPMPIPLDVSFLRFAASAVIKPFGQEFSYYLSAMAERRLALAKSRRKSFWL